MLDVERGDHVDAGVEQLRRRPASASRASSRARWCGRTRRRAPRPGGGRARRRDPSPAASCRGTRSPGGARPRGPASCAAVCARPCVSTTPTTTSVPRSARRRPSLSIAKVLPTPGARRGRRAASRARGSIVRRLQPVACVEREVELQHVDGRDAEDAERCARRCARRSSRSTSATLQAACGRDALRLQAGVGDADVRVEAGARCGDRVDRHELRRRRARSPGGTRRRARCDGRRADRG